MAEGTIWSGRSLSRHRARVSPPPMMTSNRLYFALALTVPLALTTWFYQEYIHHTYVICSKSQKIYTVDESIPNAACISIHGTRIVAVGELGNHFQSSCPFGR
jgi:hypothetical protein